MTTSNTLWWLGEGVTESATRITLKSTATMWVDRKGAPEIPSWELSSTSPPKAQLSCTNCMESTIQSLAASPGCPVVGGVPQPQYDVWIRACASGLCSEWFSIFVHSPQSAIRTDDPTQRWGVSVGNERGYGTRMFYRIRNSCDEEILDISVNEEFSNHRLHPSMIGAAGSFWSLRPNNVWTWPQLDEMPGGQNPALIDSYQESCDYTNTEECKPVPVIYVDGQLLSPIEVDRQTQKYRAGSAQFGKGVVVRSHDYVRYENWSTTDPYVP